MPFSVVEDSSDGDADLLPSRRVTSGAGVIIDAEFDTTIDNGMEIEAVEFRKRWNPEPEAQLGGATIDPDLLGDESAIVVREHDARAARVRVVVRDSGIWRRPDKQRVLEERPVLPRYGIRHAVAWANKCCLLKTGIRELLAPVMLLIRMCSGDGECRDC